MGANLDTRMKMTQRQMRLINALKLMPVFPVPPAAMPEQEEPYVGMISDPTVMSRAYFPNHDLPMGRESPSNATIAGITANATHVSENVMPAASNTVLPPRQPLITSVVSLARPESDLYSPSDEYGETVLVIDDSEPEENDAASIKTEVSSAAESTATNLSWSAMKAELFAENAHKSRISPYNLLQQTCYMMSGMQPIKSQAEFMAEARTVYLESWEQNKLAAMCEVERKFAELIAIKDKVRRLKKNKSRLTKLRDKQHESFKRMKMETALENINAQEAFINTSQFNYSTPNASKAAKPLHRPYATTAYPTTPTTAAAHFNYASTTSTTPTSSVHTPSSPASSHYQNFYSHTPTTHAKNAHMYSQTNERTTPLKRTAMPSNTRLTTIDFSTMPCDEFDLYTIGPNGTKVAKAALQNINWSLTGAAVTRKILMEVFDRDTLAFHTLTGKPSPAFLDCNKPMKGQLDPAKVADIIYIVTKHLKMTDKEVRQAITTKCADENKMYRQRERKRLGLEREE